MPATLQGSIITPDLTAAGEPVANGTLVFLLTGARTTVNGQMISDSTFNAALDQNGSFSVVLFANTELTPSGSTYTLWVKDSGGGQLVGPLIYSITATGIINLSTLTPVG